MAATAAMAAAPDKASSSTPAGPATAQGASASRVAVREAVALARVKMGMRAQALAHRRAA
eukprot:scaffold51412_cov36-Phaeocystis_antarctica.AAC.1